MPIKRKKKHRECLGMFVNYSKIFNLLNFSSGLCGQMFSNYRNFPNSMEALDIENRIIERTFCSRVKFDGT